MPTSPTRGFPFGTSREIDIGYAHARAMRVSYVGELGWELHIATEYVVPVFDRLMETGADLGVGLCGIHAMDSLRSEKGYRHWGHDITQAETPLEAGLGFAVSFRKDADFIGREALERQREEGLTARLVHVMLEKAEPFMFHDETIYLADRVVGRITSAAFGYGFDRPVGMGYLLSEQPRRWQVLDEGRYEVDIAGERVPATMSLTPFYDSAGERLRS